VELTVPADRYGLSVENVQVRARAKERASTTHDDVEAYGEYKTMAEQSLPDNPFAGLFRSPYTGNTHRFEETRDMNRQPRQTTKGIGIGSMAATALALGGLSLSAVAAAPAGAESGRLAKSVVVKTVSVANIGTVLASGKTLYTLKASSTPCTAACLKIWPELVLPKGVKKATAGSGVRSSKLGTVTRAHGVRQVTFGGKPLYWFVNDTGPGQVHGNITDTWGRWTAVVTAKAKSSGTASTAGSGGTAF